MNRRKSQKNQSRAIKSRRNKSRKSRRRIGGMEPLEDRRLLAGDFGVESFAWHDYVPADVLNDPEIVVSKPDSDGNIRVIIETTAKQQNQSVISAFSQDAKNIRSLSELPVVIAEVPVDQLDEISQMPNVRSVSVDYAMPPALNDSVEVIGADVVHDNGTRGAGTTIAILDTGIDSTHDFFGTNGSRIVEQRCFSTIDPEENEQSLCPNGLATDTNANVNIPACLDDEGDSICDHGTHVAGIAAGSASTDSSAPGDGVAPGANIIAIQVFHRQNDSCGSRPGPCTRVNNSDVIAGLNAVAAINAANPSLNIVSANMSLGSGRHSSNCDSLDAARKTAIDNLLANNIATVVASGNSGLSSQVAAPGCISSAFTVGSTTNSDDVSSFSNRGVLLDVFAPGGGNGVLGTGGITSSVAGGGYAQFSGTSMAAPHVAGALAVLREDNPDRPISALMNDLKVNGKPITYNSNGTNITTKRIDVLGSLSGDSNDAMSEAPTIRVGDSNSDFSLGETYDVDMFKFSVTGGAQQIFIEVVERNNSNLDPFLRLFDEAGNELAADSNNGSASAELDVLLPGSGTYFIGVSSENNEDYNPITGFGDSDGDASGAFTLTIGDNNDALSEAIPMAVPQTQPGTIDLNTDVDLFSFNAVAGTTYAFDVDITDGSSLDSFLRVFDAAGNQVAFDDDGASGDGPLPEGPLESFLEFTAPSTGPFFVGVSSFGNTGYDVTDGSGDSTGSTTGGYTLTSFFPNAAGNDDSNDQLHEASNLAIGATSGTFTIDNTDDVDMFRIDNVPAGQTLGFDVDNILGSGLDAELRLWDADGNLLAQDDDSFGPAPEVSNLEPYIEHTFNDAGTYFVSVAAFNNDFYDPISGLFDNGTTSNLGQFTLSITDENVVDPANQRIVTIADDIVAIDGETSLREAIAFTNSNPGQDTITFETSLIGSTITLTEGELSVTGSTIIAGRGADRMTISGNNESRIFNASLQGSLEIRDLTLADGNTSGDGGAILSEADVTILNSRLVGNSADNDGGAIYVGPFQTLEVISSELSGNTAEKGGAIALDAGSTFITTGNITNSTISGNSAEDGGGIYARGANLTVRSSTIAANTEGIHAVANSSSTSPLIANSIVANNGFTDVHGEVRLSNSLLESTINTTIDDTQSNDSVLNVDPNVGPLADNGGPTLTHALLDGSPAINAGSSTAQAGVGNTPQFDQRGTVSSRVKLGRLDMGAFESDFEANSGLVTIATDTVAVDGETSLREAVEAANNFGFVSTITFDPSLTGQTIQVTNGELSLERSVSIIGPGANQLTIDAGGNSRIFLLDSGADDIPDDLVDDPTSTLEGETFLFEGVTLTGGFVPSPSAGGAINLADSLDTLELDRVMITNSSGNAGGAMRLAGRYEIQNSTFTDNTANFAGAAIFALGTSDGTIVNSTISGNTSGSGAGAIQLQSNANATMEIANTTIANNSAQGIQVFAYSGGVGTITMSNSLFADNSGVNGAASGSGAIISEGHNLSDDGSSVFNGTGDLINTNAGIGPLQNNGGTTLTHALLVGSPAINAGDPNFTTPPATDQTGATRVRGGRLDIGSVEVQDDAPTFTSSASVNAPENQTLAQTLSAIGGNTFSLTGNGADASKFQIVSGNQLRFLTAPDFENPTDVGGNNVYEVEVQVVSNLGIPATQSVSVTVTDVNDNAPVFTSSATAQIEENSTVVQTLTANAGGPVSFSIVGGADQSRFNLSGSDQLRFNTAPDFENPTDAGGDNIYNVTVRATSGGLTTDQNVTVEVFGVNEFTPVITSSPNASLPENTTFVTTVTATDNDAGGDGEIFYMIAPGLDANLFDLDSFSGELTFRTAPDFENPNSVSGTNAYQVNLQVEDQGSLDTFQLLTINVQPVNDNAPTFTSGASVTIPENTTAVQTLTAIDADLPGDNVTFSITGGVDAGEFQIVNGNELRFVNAPDFENPTDSNGNNVYIVQLTADDGAGRTTNQNFSVRITDVVENTLRCDFDGDADCDGADIDALQENVSNGPADPGTFDLTGDGQVTIADRNEWLALAGAENLASGNPYRLGDANLDGSVDISDFNLWNSNKFTPVSAWTRADFNSDGSVDISDFNIWNANKFTSSDSAGRGSTGSLDLNDDRRDESKEQDLLDRLFAEWA